MGQGGEGLPAAFLERLPEIVPAERLADVLASFEAPRRTSLRVNRLKAEPDEVCAELGAAGFELEQQAWYADAFVLVSGELRALQETSAYQRGALYVQSLSSMLAPLFLDVQPGETVLDLCAAPGSKTTQLAAMMGGSGELHANDRSRKRRFKLERVLADQGADAVQVWTRKGEAFGHTHAGAFDRVLADVPCSSEGRFRSADPKSYADWKPAKIKRLAAEQRRLLISGLHALRPGGRLVYSTCTFAPEENEAVLHKVLRYFKGAARLVEPPFEPPDSMPGKTSWRDRELDPQLALARRILPGGGLDGFFLACLELVGDREFDGAKGPSDGH